MRHFAQRCRALTTPAQPEGFQPGAFIGDDGTERPTAAKLFCQPDQIVIIDSEDTGVAVRQRRCARFGITYNRLHFDIAQMSPLNRLIRPGTGRHAQRCEDQRGLCLRSRHEEIFQRGERRHGFTHAHSRPEVAAVNVDFVVDNEVLIRARGEYFTQS